jgi:eukaryotic-like serine/threonine-protein kinase
VQSIVVDSRYTVRERLGDGGMGEVYLAHDVLLGRDVALKVLREPHAARGEFVERFRREARHAAGLSHPNIVEVYDAGEAADGAPYMAMEYLPGGTLRDRLDMRGALPPRTAAEVALQIAEALAVAHGHGVVHRDIKPENVLVTENGDVKVADFGIARASDATVMTQTNLVLGTVRYISPEQAMARPVGPASDLYSLGVVLYEMLAGEVPFEAEGPIAVAMKHLTQPPVPLRELAPAVPADLEAITARLMRKDPARRYGRAGDLARDLERYLAGERPLWAAKTARIAAPAVARRGRRASRRRRLLPAALAAILLAAVLVPIAAGLAWSAGVGSSVASIFDSVSREPVRRVVSPSTPVRGALESPAPPQDARRQVEDGGPETEVAQEPPVRPAPVLQAPASGPVRVAAPEPQVTVAVPDLVGMSVAEAEAAMSDVGLILRVASYATSSSVPEGTVLSQDAPPGYEASPGATVAVVVSSGPPAPQPAPSRPGPETIEEPQVRVPKVKVPEIEVPRVGKDVLPDVFGANGTRGSRHPGGKR